MKRLCTPAANDTTFEPSAGNGRPGSPVTALGKAVSFAPKAKAFATKSGGLVRNQGGTVEYII